MELLDITRLHYALTRIVNQGHSCAAFAENLLRNGLPRTSREQEPFRDALLEWDGCQTVLFPLLDFPCTDEECRRYELDRVLDQMQHTLDRTTAVAVACEELLDFARLITPQEISEYALCAGLTVLRQALVQSVNRLSPYYDLLQPLWAQMPRALRVHSIYGGPEPPEHLWDIWEFSTTYRILTACLAAHAELHPGPEIQTLSQMVKRYFVNFALHQPSDTCHFFWHDGTAAELHCTEFICAPGFLQIQEGGLREDGGEYLDWSFILWETGVTDGPFALDGDALLARIKAGARLTIV